MDDKALDQLDEEIKEELEPEPEPKPDPTPEPEPKAEEKETVPLATFLETRNQLKAQIKELEQRAGGYDSVKQELDALKAKLADHDQTKSPDFMEDPKGYLDHNVKSLADKVRELESKGKATEEQIEQHRLIQEMERNIKAHVDSFADKTPDFDDALEFAREQRIEEFKLIYPDATSAQLQAALAAEEFRTAHTLIQQGRNPGEFIYQWAVKRGYKPAESEETTVSQEEKDKMAAARDQAEGLGSSSGTDIESLEEDDEFKEAMKEVFG